MARESLLSTADHKRLGRMQIVLSLALLAVAGSAGIFIRLQAAGGSIDHFDAMTSLHDALVGVFVVIPLWLGIATAIVPLQLGTSRLAFPKASSFALALYTGGAALVVAAYTKTPAPSAGRTVFDGVPLPGSLAKLADTKGADLLVLGMILGAVATVLMTVNLVATISARRAHGLTIGRLPYFSWSVLAAGIGIAIATPVFIGGLALVWIDQHFGGSFFTSSAANALWTHAVWLGGRPEALLPAAFLLGTGSDIISTATGKPNQLDMVTRGAIGAFVTFSFLTWTASASDAGAFLAPFVNPALALPALAAGVVVLSWLAQLRGGLKPVPALVPLVLALGVGVLGLVDGLIALTNDDRGAIWSQHSLTLFAVFLPLAGAVAALIHWAPKLVGGSVPLPLAGLSSLAVFVGSALYILSGALLGADGSADYAPAWSTADGHGGLATLGALGIIAAAGGIVILAVGFVAARAKTVGANAYSNGTTLEWAAASPPVPHNFDSVPDVTSATPLAAGAAS